MDFIGIKVSPTTNATQCIKELRKLIPLPLSEMKRRIMKGEYIYTGNPVRVDDVDKALEVYTAMINAGIEVQCIDHNDQYNMDEVLSLELLQNWCNTGHEIQKESERMWDLYLGYESESDV